MANNELKKLPYDKYSAKSIFEYSMQLIGKKLREFAYEGYTPKKGKGGIGQMVENLFFSLETNNNPDADFSAAGLELKCTPLKPGEKKKYLIKERLVCNMINYCDVVHEDFEHSHFYLKCRLMLLIFYLHEKGSDVLDFEFIFTVLWQLSEKDLIIIRQDYETIINKIKLGQAHLLSEGDTMYLGACRKGQKGDSLMAQPYSEIGAPRRAFSLKMAYMRTVLKYVEKSKKKAVTNVTALKNELVTEQELKQKNFEELLLERFMPYFGKDYREIADEKGVDISKNPKSKFAMIANAIVATKKCAHVNRSEEFIKAGLTMKTIRVQQNETVIEAMSFENIDYIEVAECDNWYDSRLYELFSSRFMFVIYKEQHFKQKDYVLDDVFFWTMPQEDLNWAETYWNYIKECILNDHISDEYWWKQSDKKTFHVRPKSQTTKDLAPTPYGWARKYCYWFNNDYVRVIVDERRKEKQNGKS